MDISDIRQKYPMYSDLSDEQLLKGFHDKFYSDMKYEDFVQKFSSAKPAVKERPTVGAADKIIPKGRQLQSLPRTLAYGVQFERAPAQGGIGDIEKGAYEAGGRVTDVTGSPALGTAVRMIPDVATTLIPAGGLAKVGEAVSKPVAEHLMSSALKKSGIDNLKEMEAATEQMLKGGYNVTKEGVTKMGERVGQLEKEIKGIEKASPLKVNIEDVDKAVEEAASKELLTPDAKTVNRIWADLRKRNIGNVNQMSVEDAHALKQRIYQHLGDRAFNKEVSTAVEKALRKVSSQLREAEIQVPGVAERLKEQEGLFNALRPAEKRLITEMANNPAGISLLAHNPAWMAAFVLDRSSAFKSILANLVNQQSAKAGAYAGAAAGATTEAVTDKGGQ